MKCATIEDYKLIVLRNIFDPRGNLPILLKRIWIFSLILSEYTTFMKYPVVKVVVPMPIVNCTNSLLLQMARLWSVLVCLRNKFRL